MQLQRTPLGLSGCLDLGPHTGLETLEQFRHPVSQHPPPGPHLLWMTSYAGLTTTPGDPPGRLHQHRHVTMSPEDLQWPTVTTLGS